MPALLSVGNGQYTPVSTIGTQTLNQGQPGPVAPHPGVLYGYIATSTGTAGMVVTYLDVIPTGTSSTTNTLMVGTATAPGQILQAGVPGVGIRYRGALILVTTGTAGGGNSLWD